MHARSILILLLLLSQAAAAQPILVDHRDVAKFDSIPRRYAEAARDLRLFFMDRSVGGNISDALSCLASPFETAPSACKRYQHRDSAYAVVPSEVHWNGVWDRSLWRYEYWPPNCSEDALCFINAVEPRIDSFDVVGFQHSYLAVMPGSSINDPSTGFFAPRTDRGTAAAMAAFAARHPDKQVIWWTTSLARGIGTPESEIFNDAMRRYARDNNLILFDVADILSHNPAGQPCYDNRDGVPYLTENYPDDSLDIPAICPQYTTETDGGHLGSISAGGIRVAKAFWVLMARIAGWDGTGDTAKAEKVRLLSPPDRASLLSDTVRFLWNRPSSPVIRYHFMLSPDSAFQSSVIRDSSLTDTTKLMTQVPRGKPIFWRVQARDASGWGPFSDRWSFTIASVPPFSQTPLTEMGKSLYKGYAGGLYPDTRNERPFPHDSAGRAIASAVVPLDTAGNADPAGRIVLLSIGMSNTTQEFSAFVPVADTFRLKNPSLTLVDGAQGGQTAAIIMDPSANFWSVVEQRLRQKSVTPMQVRAVWLKEADAGPTQGFPAYALTLKDELRRIVRFLPRKYPNLSLVYLSSRIYAGYATSALNPEPYAFESGLSVKWLIEDQIKGDTGLVFAGPGRQAPWLAWGPYLWGNGATPRLADGLIWVAGDFQSDGTHPSPSGRLKVATMLLDFFCTDSTAVPWFLRKIATGAGRLPIVPPGEISLSPQPAAERVMLLFRSVSPGDAAIDLYNLFGRRMGGWRREMGGEEMQSVSLSLGDLHLQPGVYFLRVAARGISAMKKLLVMH